MGIFDKYDDDGSGDLDKDETKKFVLDVQKKVGGKFDQDAFDALFEKADINGEGTIDRTEMVSFVKSILGIVDKKTAAANAAKEQEAKDAEAKTPQKTPANKSPIRGRK